MIKVLFCSNYNIGSLLIRLFTFSKWSHVGIVLDDNTVIDATGGKGVSVHSMHEFISKYRSIEEVSISIPDPIAAKAFLVDQIGKPYDFTALFGLVLQRDWQEPDSWFCSELLEASLVAGGRKRFKDSVSRIVPKESYAVI